MPGEREVITSKTGKYEVIRKLGEGYTGEVYLVKDLNRAQPMALKLLNPEAFKEGQLEAFKREFMLLSDLHHPHVCKVYDFGFAENKDRYFFTLEVVQGTDLYSYTEQLSIEETEEIFVQIADALGIIHSAGLVHFDVKGDNILITMAGDKPLAKIVDFGLAAPSFEAPENIAGTVRYISPEMITKKQSIDYRADLYSLGIVLYRMLAGRYPEQGQTMKEVLIWHAQHTELETKILEDRGVPKYLIEVIEKLTRRIPTERFSSAAVVIKFIELHSGKTYTKTQKRLVATLMEEGPLVARDDIIFEIRSIFSKLGKGEQPEDDLQQTLVLTGPKGSGKSRIIKEARYISQLTELDAYIIRGEVEGQNIEVFKKAVGLEGVQTPALSEELLKKQPFVLMVDNLDKCNHQVREFISGFANMLYSSKFMGEPRKVYLIVTMTTEGPKDALPVPLHLDVEHEHLAPLTAEDVTQYIRLSLGESNPPAKQVDDILKFSGGVPELVKIAIASLDSPTARLTKDSEDLFIERMKGLDPVAKKVLGCISIAEKPLNQQQLIALTGLTIETALSALAREGLISYDRASESYTVATGAISMAVQKLLTDDEKKEIGKSLLKYFEGEGPEDVDSLVKYASIVGEKDQVSGYLIKAAEAKEEKSELDDAYSYYGRLIDLLDISDERLPRIHRKLARQQLLKGEYNDALRHIEEASNLTEISVNDLTNLSWIDRLQHKPEDALVHIQKALEMQEKDDSSPDYLRLMNEVAQCYVQMGRADDAVKIFKETDAHARKLSPEIQKKVSNNNLGLAMAQMGEFDEAIKFYKEKYDFFRDERQLAASVLSQLGYVYQQAGLLTEGLDTFKKSWEIYSEISDTHSAVAILGNMVCLCQSKALFTDALEYVKESIRLASHAGSERELAGNFLTLGSLYITLALEDVARRYLNEAAQIFQKLKDKRMEAWVQISFAYLYKNLRKYKEALAYLDNVIKAGKESGYEDLILWGSFGAAEMLLDIGEVEKAEKYISSININWRDAEGANERDIKVELLRSKLVITREKKPPKEIEGRMNELAALAGKLELRELVGEIFHNLAEYHQKHGNQIESAKYVSKAKEIIQDIAGTLSEEYRESFLKQQFRQKVFEDSVRLKDLISQINIEVPEELKDKKEITQKAETPTSRVAVKVSKDQAVQQETSVFTGAYQAEGELKITGQSEAVGKIRDTIKRVKDSHATVLIGGEAGTEKELIARAIADRGLYKGKPWIKIDTSTFSQEHLESMLWGGADECVFETAGDGVIYLVEVEKMPAGLQKKFANVLQEKKFYRLKDGKELPMKARVIASTNIETGKLAKKGKVAKPLAKLLSEVVIDIPPLRERKADIPLLIDHFLVSIAKEYSVESYTVEPAALKILMQHSWPENMRELEQTLRSICVLAKDGKITEERVRVYIGS